jgi:hypothetical protein
MEMINIATLTLSRPHLSRIMQRILIRRESRGDALASSSFVDRMIRRAAITYA